MSNSMLSRKRTGDKAHSHGNMADRMEQDEEDFLPGIGELKTFSQVIRNRVSLGFKIELTDAFTFIGNRTTEILFQVTLGYVKQLHGFQWNSI